VEVAKKLNDPVFLTTWSLEMILLDGGFVSAGDLCAAIDRQRKTNEQLGKILVDMGVLEAANLRAVLAVQKDLASLDDTYKVGAGVRELLGELLIRADRLTPAVLEEALTEQRRTGEKLGAILVRQGLLGKEDLHAVLAFQKRQEAKKPIPDSLHLGKIMVRTGVITREQLQEALRHQKLSRKKIGEILVEFGHITPDQLKHSLHLQERLVAALLVGLLSFSSSLFYAQAVDLSPSPTGVRGQIAVTAVVKAYATLKFLRQVSEIVVSKADINCGYVDVPAASLIEIRSNSLEGYLLTFEGLNWPFRDVRVDGLLNELLISGNAGLIQQPYQRGIMLRELSYRFFIAEKVQPGTYAWPLMISVRPL
jgi:hypothetical protein